MNKKKSGKIWVSNKCVITNDRGVWNNINKYLKTTFHRTTKEPKISLDLNVKEFLQILGDLTAENILLGNELIDRSEIKIKLAEYVKWKFKPKITDKVPPNRLKQIEEDLKNQIYAIKKIKIEKKINTINGHFRDGELDENIIENVGTKIKLNVYSFKGPPRIRENIGHDFVKSPIRDKVAVGKKPRIIIFGPTEDKINEFCSDTATYLNKDKSPEAKDRFYDVMLNKIDYSFSCLYMINSRLKKDKFEKPDFFRRTGPLWIDFEKGYVVERSEVNDIISKMEKYQIHLLLGDASSGKSTLASSIAYKLNTEKGWDVSYLRPELFQTSTLMEIKNDIDSFCVNKKNSLIIIEDFHRNSSSIFQLMENIGNKKTRFLITSRKSFESGLKSEESYLIKQISQIYELDDQNFDEVADELIESYRAYLREESAKSFKKITPEIAQKIKNISNKNFWVLKYLLEGWESDKEINLDIVFNQIKKDLEDLKIEFRNKYDLWGITDVLLSLASFSLHEIGVSKYFFDPNYGIINVPMKTIDILIEYGEIQEEDGDYFIPHSTIAELYFKTALYQKSKKGNMLQDVIQHLKQRGFSGKIKDFPLSIYQSYLQTEPNNYGRFVNKICSYESAYCGCSGKEEHINRLKYRENVPLKKLLFNKKTFDKLVKTVNEDDDIANVGKFLFGLWFAKYKPSHEKNLSKWILEGDFISQADIREFTERIDKDALILNINQEESLNDISECLNGIKLSGEIDFQRYIIRGMDIESLKIKINEKNISFKIITEIVSSLIEIEKELTKEFLNILVRKVKETKSSIDLLLGVQELYETRNGELYYAVKKSIDINHLLNDMGKNINTFEDVFWILYHFSDIVLKEQRYSGKLIDVIIVKINEINKIDSVICSLAVIGNYGKSGLDRIEKIISNINLKDFQSKIEKDPRSIASLWNLGKKYRSQDIAEYVIDHLELTQFMNEKMKKSFEDFVNDRGPFRKANMR